MKTSQKASELVSKRKPVVPNMSDPEYRAEPGISNSNLSLLLSSPKGFQGVRAGELEGFSSSGFEIGSALDMMVLQPDLFDSTYLLEPLGMEKPSSANQVGFCTMLLEGVKASDAIRENYKVEKKTEETIAKMAFENIEKFDVYINFQRAVQNGKLTYSQRIMEELLIMKVAIEEHKHAGPVVRDEVEGFVAFSQLAIFWNMFDIDCKALLDRCLIDKKNKVVILYDLKYTGQGVGFFEDSIRRYRYYRQLAWYATGLQIIFPSFKIKWYIIAVTPKWGGECRVLSLPKLWIDEGIKEAKDLVDRFKWHTDHNLWEYRREYYEQNGIEVIPYDKAS